MKKAFVTFGTGKYAELLDIARPSYQAFAKRHGYDYFEAETVGRKRPAPWYKVRCLQQLLKEYDLAVYFGCDLVIVDGRQDFPLPDNADGKWLQAMVAHETGDGHVPNTDMWIVWRGMAPILEQVWSLEQFAMHGWWEQAALMTLMSYNVDQRPTRCFDETNDIYQRTYWLENEWNMHRWDRSQPWHQRIQHATMWPDRAGIMRQWAQQAEGWING